jgi:hypothetical protein
MKILSQESLFPSRDSNQHLANTNQRNYVSVNLLLRQKYCSCTFIFNVSENVNTLTCVRDLNTSPTGRRHAQCKSQQNEPAARLQIPRLPRYGGMDSTPMRRERNKKSKSQSEREDETCLDNSGQKTLTECQSVVCRHSSNVTCQHLPLGTRRLNPQNWLFKVNFYSPFARKYFEYCSFICIRCPHFGHHLIVVQDRPFQGTDLFI